ncbi:MAG: DinB family protein [Cyclobacteriaceae bacterium]|nr:DinB family protein [Cyclobacteriaceae bacterium]UYN86801.1 MAG: DinB family protein [Cyclobacteriaceae bacterium]
MKTSPDFNTLPAFYRNYVSHVEKQDMLEAMGASGEAMQALLRDTSEDKGVFRYAPEKWSVKELLCHMMDAERIFAYRALRFARNDKTPLAGFEENDYAPQANAHSRSLQQLAAEMKRLRASTIDLFASFSSEMLERTGTANNNIVSVVNIGYIISGHETHHRKVLIERYLNSR